MAEAMGGDTVFNYVHPNNEGMIHFLRSKGYTVLNMIEIRRPYQGEKLASTIQVGNNDFDYWIWNENTLKEKHRLQVLLTVVIIYLHNSAEFM